MSTDVSSDVINLSDGASGWLSNQRVCSRIGSALAGWMTGEEFISQVLIAFQKPEIRATTPKSQFEAAHTCAALQLVPTLGHVALIPRNCNVNPDKKSKPVFENQCHVMVQWQGYQAIMIRHPEVLDVEARLVMDSDEFEFDGTTHAVTHHQYDPFEDRILKPNLSNLRGGYLIVSFKDGRKKFHVVTADHILKTKKCAQTPKIWEAWPEPMCLKALYRSGYARRVVPVDPMVEKRLQMATEADDVTLGNDPRRVVIEQKPKSLADITNQVNGTQKIEVQEAEELDLDTVEPPTSLDQLDSYLELALNQQEITSVVTMFADLVESDSQHEIIQVAIDKRANQLGIEME